MPTRLPLFPLRVVLFPGALLPLHIFEPRYRQLLLDLSAQDVEDRHFGILPPGPDGELPEAGAVGCVARLRGVQQLPDGRANIVVSGERRFVFLAAAAAPSPYHQGLVRWLDDLAEVQVPSEQEITRLALLGARLARARQAIEDRAMDVDLPRDAAGLSFAVAAWLEWEYDALQQFLAIRSVSERVTRLLTTLPSVVADAEARATLHARAQGNGHGTPV